MDKWKGGSRSWNELVLCVRFVSGLNESLIIILRKINDIRTILFHVLVEPGKKKEGSVHSFQ